MRTLWVDFYDLTNVHIENLKEWHIFSIDYFYGKADADKCPEIYGQASIRYATGLVRDHYPKLFLVDPEKISRYFDNESNMLGSKVKPLIET